MIASEIQKSGESLVFPKFEDIKVSTKTFIVMTNLLLDLENLFEFLPITDYVVVKKKEVERRNIVTKLMKPKRSMLLLMKMNQFYLVQLLQ